ncbi:MEDS domain-containing protein [Streptomyces endophyticus]|uniref:MEDS domain-containing protein n=1 Tax=Streptomyces endophyticus TaxID=714166 RepID=A0ABU6F6Q3_9ACTN|nr:MEDS domain-containing protein [Streptomyces endophyticus]MEB8339332.1 MEDS domain-containing protein [Streptomyces endophyticus]
MADAEDAVTVGTIPVQQLRAGDHAFVGYDDDDAGRDVASAFAWSGLAQREKVMVFAAPQLAEDEVWNRLDAPGPLLGAARDRGQLVVTSMRTLIHPAHDFTPERQWERIEEETDLALKEGYRGLRTYIDMHWVGELNADVAVMMHRESHAHHLFTGRPYTEICAYDSRWFAPEVLTAMHEAHPCRLLPRLGALHTEQVGTIVRLAGEADIATRDQFIVAVREGLARSADAGRLTVDLSQVIFLSAACAVDLLRLAVSAAHDLIEVRCHPTAARILRRVHAESLPNLLISEVSR